MHWNILFQWILVIIICNFEKHDTANNKYLVAVLTSVLKKYLQCQWH